MTTHPGDAALRRAIRARVGDHLDRPDVTSVDVSFAVEYGQPVGPPVVRLGTGRQDGRRPDERRTRGTSAPGFDTGFLAHPVALPTLTGEAAADALVAAGSQVLDYTHFSLTMSASRRFARWVAWNVDGAAMKKLSRAILRFRPDPRIPVEAQVGDELYAGNRLDRGHIARRADLTWGNDAEAQQANVDSFHFTNIAPQLDDFNQSRREGVWGRIEDAVYEQVDVQDLRISVLGGPVLHDDDPVYRSVALPREFWKVVVYVAAGRLQARAFLLTQHLDRLEVLDLDEFRAYQVTLDDLSARTSIDFGPELTAAGGTTSATVTAVRPLETVDQIRW